LDSTDFYNGKFGTWASRGPGSHVPSVSASAMIKRQGQASKVHPQNAL